MKLLVALGTLVVAFGLALGFDLARPARPAFVPAPAGTLTTRALDAIQARVGLRPEDPSALRDLGLLYLQLARETADPTYYGRAHQALEKARSVSPNDPDTLVGLGTLALVRHKFADALALGEQAQKVAPKKAAVYGVVGDALVELGRYDEAFDAIQTMVDLRPDLASYSRVSYARELQGDRAGAIQAMRAAVTAGSTAGEQAAWTRVQLGNLLLQDGQVAEAEREYRWALAADPNNMPAEAGLGRARLTAGDYAAAIPFYERAVERYPAPDLVLTLGDLYEAVGRRDDAAKQFALARALEQLVAANGGDADLELALFEAERGDPAKAVELARGAVGRRKSIHAYDALAWALYAAGDYAAARDASDQALRLGTDDGLMLFHAGMIDLKLGDTSQGRARLVRALERNPGFSARWVPVAKELTR